MWEMRWEDDLYDPHWEENNVIGYGSYSAGAYFFEMAFPLNGDSVDVHLATNDDLLYQIWVQDGSDLYSNSEATLTIGSATISEFTRPDTFIFFSLMIVAFIIILKKQKQSS